MQTNEEIREKIHESHHNKNCPRSVFTKAATPCFRTCLSASIVFFLLDLKIDGAHAVPYLELKLLDSNFVEPSNYCSGLLENTLHPHTLSTIVPFNFSQVTLTLTFIFNQYHKYIEKWPEPFRTQVEEVAEISRSCLADKLQQTSMTSWTLYHNMKSSQETSASSIWLR